MARTVGEAFQTFYERIGLTELQREDAETKIRGVRECLEQSWELDNVFLTGSYRRRTMISPPKDIDLLVVLDYEEHGDDYYETVDGDEALLERVHRDLKSAYPTTRIRKDRPAVNLDFTTVGFDVVPGFRRHGGGFQIPHPLRRGWLSTNPRVHRRRVEELDATTNGRLVRVATMLKEWNVVNFDHLTGFHVEMALTEAWPEDGEGEPFLFKNSAEAVASLLPALGRTLEDTIGDPAGLSGAIDEYLDDDPRELTIERLDRDAERAAIARRHQARGDHERAIRRWRRIFGERFPAYG